MLKRWPGVLAALLTCASFVFLPYAWADVAIPALKSRVTDLTGTLTREQTGTLEERLKAFEAQKGTQIAVLMLASTKPEAIEQFSIRLAEAWKIGRKGTDDGLIVVVAKEDRRLRIEVGYGLEGAIPDAVANRVISETMTPRFKAGDFYGGVSNGIDQLIKLVEGEKLPPPAATQNTSGQSDGSRDPFGYVVPAFFLVLLAGALFRAIFGRFPGAIATGLVAGGVAWFLFSMGVAALFALFAFIFAAMNTGRGAGLGGFSSGSSGGSWSSGGGGGGFSGGGGSFGGGGSSGSW